ncbi:MAG TPA: lysylphosphatidylglycerol synthase domain-containing protein [Bryobacterales bacterium]|nr:lysylphosphatidylglycerol synthase domain-containing protein [Bryobacterales bacterium]
MIKRLLPWLKWLVPLAVAFFIGRVIHLQWQKVRAFEWRFDFAFLALSFLATSFWFFARTWVWRKIVLHFGFDIPYRESMRIFVLSELSRYVPGTVWQYFSRIYLAARWGVPAAVTLSSALMELLLLALAAVPLVLWHLDDVFPIMGRAQEALLLVFPAAAVLLLQPAVLNRMARLLLPRLRMRYVPIELSFRAIAGLWAVCLLIWIVFGTGFVLFARSLAPIGLSHGVQLVSKYAISWLIGVVTFFAPGGIGVREGILGLLLGKTLPLGTAFIIAVLSRLWLVALELFWGAVSQLYFRVQAPAAAAEAARR